MSTPWHITWGVALVVVASITAICRWIDDPVWMYALPIPLIGLPAICWLYIDIRRAEERRRDERP